MPVRRFIEAVAAAPITKTGKPFSKYRYTISLNVNEVGTAIHAHARTKAGARKASRLLASEASELLEESGLMPTLFQKLIAAADGRPELPAVGSIVYLTKEVAGLQAGFPLLVTESEWTEEDADSHPENAFPVMAWPLNRDDLSPIPLALGEYSTTVPEVKA